MTVQASSTLKINGFAEYIEKLQEAGANVDNIAVQGLYKTSGRCLKEMHDGIKRHHRTGRTQEQIVIPKVLRYSNGFYCVDVGFKLPLGIASRYIDRGTPTIKKDPFVDRALNLSKMKRDQKEIFDEIMSSVKGG